MAAAPQTGITNADNLINLAHAFGLTVTVETTDRETLTSYTVRISIPVPPAYEGTELGRAIAGDTITLLWTKAHRSGARGRLEDATRWTVDSHHKLRTQERVTAHIHALGHQSARYVRETAPQVEDVVDARHALFIDGEERSASVSVDFVRRVVSNRRHHGRPIHQDTDGAIVIENRRYVPQTAPAAEQPAPAAEERQHIRTVNGGTPQLIPTRDALAEINAAMMGPGKREVRSMSEARGHARIVYRDGRTVDLRSATDGTAPAVQEQRPTVRELTGDIPESLLAYFAETYAAVADGTAIPVSADMVRPGMDVIAAVRMEDRTVDSVAHHNAPGTVWVSITWTTRDHNDSVMDDRRVFEPGHHLVVTVASLERLYGAAPAARPAAEVLAADPIPAGLSVLEGMPGEEIVSAGQMLRSARETMLHEDYVVQIRNHGEWILPNHDDQAAITRGRIAGAIRWVCDSAPGRARATVDTDGTVYLSNGYQAARYIPAALIAGYSVDVCPGCDTPYAVNGDGPCASLARLEPAGR
ncbi:hypothetical protein ACWEGS_28735 [Streptomyces sp. NPDC004822]